MHEKNVRQCTDEVERNQIGLQKLVESYMLFMIKQISESDITDKSTDKVFEILKETNYLL